MSNQRKPEKPLGSQKRTIRGFSEEFQGLEGSETAPVFGSETASSSPPELHGFGARIARLRKARGFTQDALSDAVLTSLSAVKAWEVERSAPRIEQAVRLAEVLNISLDYLFLGREDAELPSTAEEGFINETDRATLIASLDFVELSMASKLPAHRRGNLVLVAAQEFRRAGGLVPPPMLQIELFGQALAAAEQLLAAAGAEATSARRIDLALRLYEMTEKLKKQQ